MNKLNSTTMGNLCIIPARGGSKRIPRKNIKDFLGKPIIAYSIQTALKSKLFDEVMVSTDDAEIAAVSEQYGAVVPFMRSRETSDDYATTAEVLMEVLQSYMAQGKKFDAVCCIYPTAPLILVDRLKQGFDKLVDRHYDTVFPIVKFSYPIWRALAVTDEKVSMFWPENLKKRSQDLPVAYHDAGQWYWCNGDQIITGGVLWTDNTFGLEVEEIEVQDIDNESDWKLAELKYELLQNS